jgi:hypothetical protein
MIRSHWLRGSVSAVPRPGISACCIVIGANTSTDCPTSVPLKPAGATPTIVNGVPLRRMREPTALGSPPNWRIQKPWLNTATGPRGPPEPGTVSSSLVIAAPRAGRIPSTEK